MVLKRYGRTRIIGLGFRYATSYAITAIRENIANGNIKFEERILNERVRLDILAGDEWGDGRLGWVIAAASGIGWGLQVPPGTLIRIPDLEDIGRFVG